MTQKFTFDDIDIGYSFDGPAVSSPMRMPRALRGDGCGDMRRLSL